MNRFAILPFAEIVTDVTLAGSTQSATTENLLYNSLASAFGFRFIRKNKLNSALSLAQPSELNQQNTSSQETKQKKYYKIR